MKKSTLLVLTFFLFTNSVGFAANKAAPKRQKKNAESMTLDDYERELDSEEVGSRTFVEGSDSGDSRKNKKKFSYTEFSFGPGLTAGEWSSQPTNNTILVLSINKLLIPKPTYFTIGANSFISAASPRSFALYAMLGGGLMYVKSHLSPFAGFKLGAGRIISAQAGRAFGLALGPEIGFFPFMIKEHPISLKVQYQWLTDKIRNNQPRWFAMQLGFVL